MYVYYATLCTFVLCKSKKDQRNIKEKYIQNGNCKFKNTAQVRIKKPKYSVQFITVQYRTLQNSTVQCNKVK